MEKVEEGCGAKEEHSRQQHVHSKELLVPGVWGALEHRVLGSGE